MERIIKSSAFDEITSYEKAYWWAKSPEERPEAALRLILHAKEIYRSNPKNAPLYNGTRIFKSDTPIERRKG